MYILIGKSPGVGVYIDWGFRKTRALFGFRNPPTVARLWIGVLRALIAFRNFKSEISKNP